MPNDSEAMEQFLDASTGLEQVILTPNCANHKPWVDATEHQGYTRIFIALSKLPHLNHLQWPTITDASRVQAAQEQTTRPFSSLQQLKSRMESDAFGPLLAIISGLKVLDTLVGQQGLEDDDDRNDDYSYTEIFPPIAQCHSLEALELYLPGDPEIDGSSFMQIPSNCSNLKVLKISCTSSLRIDLNRAEMNTFATSLPELRELEICEALYFDASNLRSFARCCSGLEECTIDWMELLSLRTEKTPLFPKLRKLYLYPRDYSQMDESAESEYIKIIKHHMPRLEDFYLDEVEKEINRSLKEWTESKKRSN